MNKNKGFTLVELLVAVAILGIITGMSIPLIRNIQHYNAQKKFKEYGKVMLSSAKLYRDSYEEDLFGRKKSGCALISLSQLMDKGLIKDYPEENITCNYEDTMVRIIKINKQYGYSYQLLCGTELAPPSYTFSSLSKKEEILKKKIQNSKTEEESIDLEESPDNLFDEFSLSSCNTNSSMIIEANPAKGLNKADSYPVKINISSNTGISNTSSPINIQYAWVEAPDVITNTTDTIINEATGDEIETIDVDEVDFEIDYNTITDWKPLKFSKIESESSQEEKLISSSVGSIQATSYKISPPTTVANKWYLVLKINNLKNLTGEDYQNSYETFGLYNIAKKYTLTYDDNGGSGCSSEHIDMMLGKGETGTWGELCTPTKDGNIFDGWNTAPDGKGTIVTESTPVTANTRVYAKWTTSKVVIRYKLMSDETLTASTSTTATPPVNYNWRKGNDDLIERSIDGGEYKVYTTSIASGKNRELNLANYNYDHGLIITSNAGYTRAKSGAEWICESGCKTNNQTFSHDKITIHDTDTICDASSGNCTISVRVNWDSSSIAATPVSLDSQGGSGGSSAIYSKNNKWYSTGNPTATTNNITSITKPSKPGNSFGGYYSETSGSGTQKIKPDGTITAAASGVTSATTWFAKWTLNTCTINFLPNGGKFNSNASNTTQTLQYGKSVSDFWNANGGTYSATRTGYTINSSNAWLLSGTNKTFDETRGYKATDICNSLTTQNQTVNLKANWQVKKVAVTFNCNGGIGGGSQEFTYGVSNQKFSKTCSRGGFTLLGWAANKNASAKQWNTASGVSDSWINSNSPKITIYAVWKKNASSKCENKIFPKASSSGDVFNLRYVPHWGKDKDGWCGEGMDLWNRPTCSTSLYYIGKGYKKGRGWSFHNDSRWKVQVLCDKESFNDKDGIKIITVKSASTYCYRSESDYGIREYVRKNGKNQWQYVIRFVRVKIMLYDKSKKQWNQNLLTHTNSISDSKPIKSLSDIKHSSKLEIETASNGDIYGIFYMSDIFLDGVSCP